MVFLFKGNAYMKKWTILISLIWINEITRRGTLSSQTEGRPLRQFGKMNSGMVLYFVNWERKVEPDLFEIMCHQLILLITPPPSSQVDELNTVSWILNEWVIFFLEWDAIHSLNKTDPGRWTGCFPPLPPVQPPHCRN